MASVITIAFEGWKAQEAASGKPVLLNEFVFANVPNLDPNKPIDRNEKLPPANQIVCRQAVNKAGLASENTVAYSVTLGAEVGDFDFNWIGLLNKESNTVAMITHAPSQKKLKTQNGQQGNVLIRSFLLEFQGAAEETQIKTSAETWQIDFTARLTGIDEMQRLINVDSYGVAAFFDDGFEVTRSAEQFTVKKGLGYVGGLRGQLEQNQILNGLRNTKVYADFSYQGNIVSQWRTVIKITAAATLTNYVDAAGFTHQVFAVASIDASGSVKDLRPKGALSNQSLAEFEKKFNSGLEKKQDKGDYALRGESYTKTETNIKFQPIGNYQPSGDYATNTALNNGLALKFDKTGGVITGDGEPLKLKRENSNVGIYLRFLNHDNNRMGYVGYGSSDNTLTIANQVAGSALTIEEGKRLKFNGIDVMKVGDFGIGSPIRLTTENLSQVVNQGVYMQPSTANATLGREYPIAVAGSLYVTQTASNISLQEYRVYNNASLIYYRYVLSNGSTEGTPWIKQYNTGNTTVDRNGNLNASGSHVLSDHPVGSPIPWPQSTAPTGYLVCNGQSFNKTTYPFLATAYTSGILPDLRGEFLRGLDSGRGIDTGRAVLSVQGDEFRAHNHSVIGEDSGSGTAYFGRGNGSRRSIGKDAMNLEGGTETRPRNIAFLYIVRAA